MKMRSIIALLHDMHSLMKGEKSMNVAMLKKKIGERGINVETLAEKIGIDRSTMYRKLNADISTTVAEAVKIKDALGLTNEEARSIFFG